MPKPLANKELVVSDAVRKRMSRTKPLRPDYQWPKYHVVAEYLGDEEHASHAARVEDKNRQQNYAMADYKAFFLMFDDVRSIAAINQTALMLAREFAKHGLYYEPYRIRKLCKKEGFKDCQLKLVTTLLPPVVRRDET